MWTAPCWRAAAPSIRRWPGSWRTGCRERCAADVGIGLTGVAGPDPQDGSAVGTWYCALAGPGGYRDERAAVPTVGDGRGAPAAQGRRLIRAAAVRAALEMLSNIPATIS